MSENLRKAQLLADTAFDMLMWDPSGTGEAAYTPRPITERQRDNIESMTALAGTYADLAGAEAAEATVEAHDRVMNMMATGRTANSDEREI